MEYRQFLQYVAKSKGVSSGALESAMELIAFHETGPGQRMNPGAKQKGGGPGNGLFMFEAGPGQGGITAVNRTVNHLINKLKIKLPEWLAKLYKKNALDASSLSADQQKYIFLGNYLEHPRADLSKLAGGDSAIADFWLKYHWAGPSSQKEQRLNSFLHSIKAAKGEQRVSVKENGLIINMQKLFENWRKFKNEAKDPDSDADDGPELHNMAPEINKEFIEKMIGDFSFNSAQSSQHRWSPKQPVIDYQFNQRVGGWAYMAAIPDGTNNADNWPKINSKKGEDLKSFLARVENPQQLNLDLNESIDSGVLEKIVESIEKIIEIDVKNVYKSSILSEAQGTSVKVQLIGSYTEKLMEMIKQRWTSSNEREILKEMGYNVEIVPIEFKLDENYILLTKELL